jgi:hypothetical protein
MSGFHGASVDPSGWTAYTPANVVAETGSITTVGAKSGRYKVIGKTCRVQVDVTITTAGTGAGSLLVDLPFAAAAFYNVGSCYQQTTGFGGPAVVLPSGSVLYLGGATHNTFIASGSRLVATIAYELP